MNKKILIIILVISILLIILGITVFYIYNQKKTPEDIIPEDTKTEAEIEGTAELAVFTGKIKKIEKNEITLEVIETEETTEETTEEENQEAKTITKEYKIKVTSETVFEKGVEAEKGNLENLYEGMEISVTVIENKAISIYYE